MCSVCQTIYSRFNAVDRTRHSQQIGQVDVAARFGQNLSACRHRAGLTQEELALRASVHRTEVGLLERGLRVARVDTLVKLSAALAIPAGELLEGITWTPGDASQGSFEIREPKTP